MPAVQTNFAATHAPAFLGQIADGEQVTNVISRTIDQASANPVAFGDPVLQGASDGTVQSVAGGSGPFRGIAVRDATLPPSAGDQYGLGLTAAVRRGCPAQGRATVRGRQPSRSLARPAAPVVESHSAPVIAVLLVATLVSSPAAVK